MRNCPGGNRRGEKDTRHKGSRQTDQCPHTGAQECVRCGGTGYYGRIGIYEIMPVTADLRQAINRGENADVLEEIALTHGMKTLRMSAIDYALRGITTVEEVQRVAYDDEED